MQQILAGDIGGTKTILQLSIASTDPGATDPNRQPLYEATYPSADFPDLVPMVHQFMHEAKQEMEVDPTPDRACFAIAGPVVNNACSLTNLSWVLDADRLKQELAIAEVNLINDFEAVGYGVLGLEAEDLHTLQPGNPDPSAPIAVMGAGTGLGQGFLIKHGTQYQVYPSEGGHADFAPRSEIEFQLLKYLRERYRINRVSVERVVSGQGIVTIYQFLRDRQIAAETPPIAEAIRTWEREIGQSSKSVDPAAVIAQAAAEERDRLCEQTMQLFAGTYGAEAGNLALKTLPNGGLFLAGGIAAKNLPLLESGGFLQAFTDKGRVSHLLDRVPVYVVLNPSVGLIGAAIRASR